MYKLALILPGSTDYDVQGRIMGNLEIPLNEEGLQEVDALAAPLQALNLEALYCAACRRARQSAERLAGALGLKVSGLARLENLDHGLWQGMLVEDVRRKQPKVYRQWQEQPETVCPPEGEMLADARERVQAVLAKFERKHRGETVGLVVSEPLASLFRAELRRSDVGDLWKAARVHGTFELIEAPVPASAPAS